MDAGLADAQLCIVDDVLDLVHARHDGFARAEQFHAAVECGDAAVVDALQLSVRLTEAERSLHVREIAADLWMDLAGYDVARFHGTRRGQAKRMRKRVTIASPQE